MKHSLSDSSTPQSCSCGCNGNCESCEKCQCSRLNRLCHSLLEANNSQLFRNAPEKYCRSMGLNQLELEAVTDLDVMRLLELGAKPSCLEILTQTFQLSVMTLGAEQTLTDEEEFSSQINTFK